MAGVRGSRESPHRQEVIPRKLLGRADLKLGDGESWALEMMRDLLDIKAGR